MKDKPPLPVNPNGLIRSYLAQQHTAQQPAITPVPDVGQPVTPLPAMLQPKTMPLPVVVTSPAQAQSRRAPVLIKPSGMSEPVFAVAEFPTRPDPLPYADRAASQAVGRPVHTLIRPAIQPSGAWQAQVPAQSSGTRSTSASTPLSTQSKQADTHTAQPTTVLPAVAKLAADQPISESVETPEQIAASTARLRKRMITRVILVLVGLVLVVALYIIWHGSASSVTSPTITQQPLATPTGTANTTNTVGGTRTTGMIEAYITGAVKHPGVYKLESGARVYELLQAAGGPLSSADLVTLNLAAKLIDGEEVYVLTIGETPPVSRSSPPVVGTGEASTGQLVNINTASTTDMRQSLHISTTTAQKIVDYRQQHGFYTSVDQLLQVVSKSIYDKIKSLVTV